MQVSWAGGALGGPAHTGVNLGGNPANLGASPHDWGFAKKLAKRLHSLSPGWPNISRDFGSPVTAYKPHCQMHLEIMHLEVT